MARYASDKNAWGVSDRSGFRYPLRMMKKEWTGLLVGPDEYEAKHPQLDPPRVPRDPQALRNPRPDPGGVPVEVVMGYPTFDARLNVMLNLPVKVGEMEVTT